MNARDQRIHRTAVILVHDKPGGLVDEQNVVIFIDDGYIGFGGEICRLFFFLWLAEEFVVDIQL